MKTIQDWIALLEIQNYDSDLVLNPKMANNLLKVLKHCLYCQTIYEQILLDAIARKEAEIGAKIQKERIENNFSKYPLPAWARGDS